MLCAFRLCTTSHKAPHSLTQMYGARCMYQYSDFNFTVFGEMQNRAAISHRKARLHKSQSLSVELCRPEPTPKLFAQADISI